jgi:hypothetical protein
VDDDRLARIGPGLAALDQPAEKPAQPLVEPSDRRRGDAGKGDCEEVCGRALGGAALDFDQQ